MARIIIGGVLAGIIAFAWSSVSWMALPWHEATMHKMEDQDAVLQTLLEKSRDSGIYLIPNMEAPAEGEEAREMKMPENFIFAVVSKGGTSSMGAMMGLSALGCVISGLIAAWLLSRSRETTFIGKVRFVKIIGLFATATALWPNWVWWQFETWYMVVSFLDIMIAWGIAGCVLALVVKTAPIDQGQDN